MIDVCVTKMEEVTVHISLVYALVSQVLMLSTQMLCVHSQCGCNFMEVEF